jgi:DNA repair protein RecO (recombination protein O)
VTRRQLQLEPAWVLHARPWRDSSLLLEVFTRSQGRLGVVARGVRAARSRQRALLQPFSPLRITAAGRGELLTLTGIEPDGPPLPLQGLRLLGGFYANELLLRLLARSDEHAALFDHYGDTLRALGGPRDLAWCLRNFERGLLQELGYGLNLDHDIVDGTALDAGGCYEYVLEQGPRRIESLPDGGRLCFSGTTLLDIRDLRLEDPVSRRAARRLFTVALDLYLGPAPLKSRQVLESMLRMSREAPVRAGKDEQGNGSQTHSRES